MWDDWTYSASAGTVAIGFGVVSLVRDGRARRDVRSEIEQDFEVATVAGFAAGQMEGEWQAAEINLEMDFRREAAARAAERLIVLPPLWMARPSPS
jgi:hypothetical protein